MHTKWPEKKPAYLLNLTEKLYIKLIKDIASAIDGIFFTTKFSVWLQWETVPEFSMVTMRNCSRI